MSKMYLNLEVPSWYTPSAVIRSPGLSGYKLYVPLDCAAKRPEVKGKVMFGQLLTAFLI